MFFDKLPLVKNWPWFISGLIIIAGVILFVISLNKKQASTVGQSTKSQQSSTESSQSTKSAMKKTHSQAPSPLPVSEIQGKKVRIKTVKGDIVFEFFADSPMAASNFIFLAKDGFYEGLTFHRREEGFVIQGGDPSGDGTGGPGYKFNDEPVTRDYKRGIVAMANAGPNTNGSQFFIMLADNLTLPKNYTIFGNIIEGMDVVDEIVAVETDGQDKPVEDVVVKKVTIQ